jgi:integrase
MSFVYRGKFYRRSTETEDRDVAQDVLDQVQDEITQGKTPRIYFDRVIFDELAEAFVEDYRVNMKDTLEKAERSVKFLGEAFGGMRVIDITTDKIRSYTRDRMNRGYSNASINRELAALKRMFHLAARETPPKVSMIPYIPMLKESNIRKGFFEDQEFFALRDALPPHLRPVVTFAFHTGWRKGEILGLTWEKVDSKHGIVRLNPGETKNEEGRVIYLDDELKKELKALQKNRPPACPYVFHQNGKPIRDFRGSWDAACLRVGLWKMEKDEKGREQKVPSKIFHDFRRTAVRNMLRSGIREKVAMMISGHKTRSIFDRYHIVSDEDLREAAQKLQTYHEKINEKTGSLEHGRGEVIPFVRRQLRG